MEETKDTKINKIREYVATCPYLKDGAIGIDYLDNIIGYSIERVPVKSIVQKYIDGRKQKQIVFILASREAWGADVINNLLNCKFYEDFEDWIEENNDNGILPEIEGVESIECISTGYAFQISEIEARYQVEIRILYKCK